MLLNKLFFKNSGKGKIQYWRQSSSKHSVEKTPRHFFFKNAELKDLLISDLEAAGGSNTHTTSTMHSALFLAWNILNYSLKLIEWVTRHSPGTQPHEGPLCLCAIQQHSVMDHSSDPSLHLKGETHIHKLHSDISVDLN